jgi:hypothetical protein
MSHLQTLTSARVTSAFDGKAAPAHPATPGARQIRFLWQSTLDTIKK